MGKLSIKQNTELKTVIKEALEPFTIGRTAAINNAINNFDFTPYKKRLTETKKGIENDITKQLTEYLNSSLDIGLTTEDVAKLLYSLKVRMSFGLFADTTVEFDIEGFADALFDVLDQKSSNKKSFVHDSYIN